MFSDTKFFSLPLTFSCLVIKIHVMNNFGRTEKSDDICIFSSPAYLVLREGNVKERISILRDE